jgi:ribosomal protein L37AE/L43A
MYKKLCPKCHKSSFSSCDSGKWLCPSCNADLTAITLHDAQKTRTNRPQLYIIKKQIAVDNPKIKTYTYTTFQ